MKSSNSRKYIGMAKQSLRRPSINHIFRSGIISVFVLSAMSLQVAEARYASIVIDYETGKVLHAINPDTRNYPASLTKMMTLYLTFDALKAGRLSMNQKLAVSANAEKARPSKLGLRRGDSILAEDAILAIVTKSANDAAIVIAEALAGSEKKFSRQMTLRARQIGMKRTTFRNASGLPNRRQFSTARDMAILARRLMEDFPKRYHLFATKGFAFKGRTFSNHNELLETYPGTDGLKTGYTRASGFNLAASAKRKNRRIIGVIFGGKSAKKRNRQMHSLLDRGFAKLKPARQQRTAQARAPRGAVPRREAVTMASVSALAKPLKLSTFRGQTPDKWSIQVGAYSKKGPARIAANKAARHLSTAGKKLAKNKGRILVIPTWQNNAWIYRARLVGLTRTKANAACRELIIRRVNCVTVPPKLAAETARGRAVQ